MLSSCENEHSDIGDGTEKKAIQPTEYTKVFLEHELLDLAAVRAAGLDLALEEARAVLMVWSRLIAHGQDRSRSLPYIAARFITLIVRAHLPIGVGEALVPLIRLEPTPKIPDGKTV